MSADETSINSEPPTPVESAGQVGRFEIDSNSIPDGIFPDEYVGEVNEYTVVRAGVECPQCSGNVFFHPESIIPTNAVQCFNCQWSSYRYVWWENRKLTDFGDCSR